MFGSVQFGAILVSGAEGEQASICFSKLNRNRSAGLGITRRVHAT